MYLFNSEVQVEVPPKRWTFSGIERAILFFILHKLVDSSLGYFLKLNWDFLVQLFFD